MEETQDEWCFQIKKCSANVNLFPRKLFRSQYHYFSNQCRNTTLINPMLGWIKNNNPAKSVSPSSGPCDPEWCCRTQCSQWWWENKSCLLHSSELEPAKDDNYDMYEKKILFTLVAVGIHHFDLLRGGSDLSAGGNCLIVINWSRFLKIWNTQHSCQHLHSIFKTNLKIE